MERYRKAAIYMLLAFAIFTSFVLLSEIPLIPRADRLLYICTKLPFILATLPLAYFLNKNIGSQTLNALVGIDCFLYAVQGQLFRPLYIFAFCQIVILYSFLFPVSKRVFRWVVGVSLVVFLAVTLSRWQQFVDLSRHPAKSDIILVILAFTIIAWISNTFFTSERLFREEAVMRFAHVGKEIQRVVHDLKGLTNSPLLYLQVLESRLPPNVGKEAAEAMQLLSRDLEGFRKILSEVNQLTASKSQEVEDFAFAEVVASLQVILKKQLSTVSMDSDGTLFLRTDRSLLTSILMNILMNSVQAFKEREIKDPKVSIQTFSDRISVTDNGGGIEKTVLRNLADGRFISTRANGTGLGLFFVHDGMKKLGGFAKASNFGSGARVDLHFPKSIVLSRL